MVDYIEEHIEAFPRFKACSMTLEYPDLIDANFINVDNIFPHNFVRFLLHATKLRDTLDFLLQKEKVKELMMGYTIPPREEIEKFLLDNYITFGAELVRFAFDAKGNKDGYNATVPEHLGDSTNHKYILDIYGNTESWTRLPFIMLSGSVPLKVDSPYVQYFSKSLEPWKHYVPVKRDLSDLIEKIQWCK